MMVLKDVQEQRNYWELYFPLDESDSISKFGPITFLKIYH